MHKIEYARFLLTTLIDDLHRLHNYEWDWEKLKGFFRVLMLGVIYHLKSYVLREKYDKFFKAANLHEDHMMYPGIIPPLSMLDSPATPTNKRITRLASATPSAAKKPKLSGTQESQGRAAQLMSPASTTTGNEITMSVVPSTVVHIILKNIGFDHYLPNMEAPSENHELWKDSNKLAEEVKKVRTEAEKLPAIAGLKPEKDERARMIKVMTQFEANLGKTTKDEGYEVKQFDFDITLSIGEDHPYLNGLLAGLYGINEYENMEDDVDEEYKKTDEDEDEEEAKKEN